MKTKTLIASMAMSLALMGTASAGDLATMDGIPAEAMSHADMGKVEGKYNPYQLFAVYLFARNMASKPAPVYQKPVATPSKPTASSSCSFTSYNCNVGWAIDRVSQPGNYTTKQSLDAYWRSVGP